MEYAECIRHALSQGPSLATLQLRMRQLEDSFGRKFSYLRLSITDACNLRCAYCLPEGFRRTEPSEPLTLAEIRNLMAAFADLGTWKVRLTGGEPLLRRDLPEIVEAVAATPGIRHVALSTNGLRLGRLLPELRRRGLAAVNISVDSLDPAVFERITGSDRLREVLDAVDLALAAGLKVKLNAVLLRESGESELERFLEYARTRSLTVRFIELMPTGTNQDYFRRQHVSAGRLRLALLAGGWRESSRSEGDGPAVEFQHPEYQGRVGIIAPYSSDFCQTCNRLRVTSRGALRLCLFAEGEHPLRPLLQRPEQKRDLQDALTTLLARKEVSHYLPEGRHGNNRTFSAMGG